MGLRIFLDDFGTGYSSLSYLKRFPMDTVKIDKSFIMDMNADNSDRALVGAIITMAGSLGLKVVAEGIEQASQLALLRELGCGHGQGYFFSRPVAAADFVATAARINAELSASRPVK
jgi:EAL domain-containing protein (putative c-di-GMP-specific phosphodiesterase class I)